MNNFIAAKRLLDELLEDETLLLEEEELLDEELLLELELDPVSQSIQLPNHGPFITTWRVKSSSAFDTQYDITRAGQH